MKDETRVWLRYGMENLDSCRILLKGRLYNPCLQNAQQCVEKLLKAVLLERNLKFKKTHSIYELIHNLQETGEDFGLSPEDCDLFDTIYLPSKYPLGSVLPDFDPDEALCSRCLGLAETVAEKVKSYLASK